MVEKPRVLVMGCGGIGGIIAASLFERGCDVVAVTHNAAIAEAINARGFEVRDDGKTQLVAGRASEVLPANPGSFDFAFLCTQPPQLAEAARVAASVLRPTGAAVTFQNGLCEQHVARIVGDEATLGAIVAWGGSMIEPGVYDRTSEGGFVIGRLDGTDDPRFGALAGLLAPIGPVDVSRNLRGARWSKLAINCAISSLGTVGGDRLGALVRYRFVRRLALEVMTEVVAVARARDVDLEKVAGTIDLDWVALTPADVTKAGSASLLAKHAVLLAVGAKFRRLRSSMLAAIERGREPAVDFLNGEVTRRAEEEDVLVPLNQRIQATIHGIARRELRPSLTLLRQVYNDSREEVYAATLSGHAPAPPARASAR